MFTQNDQKQGDFIVKYQGMLYMLYIIYDWDPKSVDLSNLLTKLLTKVLTKLSKVLTWLDM